jgi:hypothetical protein
MTPRTAIRFAVCGLVLVSALGMAGPAQARRYAGVHVKGSGFIGRGAGDVQLRLVCPPATQSTPRPGDFSFCTGNLTVRVGRTVVARGPFSIRTFDSHLEHFPTLPRGRGRLSGRRVSVRWSARSHDGRGRVAGNGGRTTVHR